MSLYRAVNMFILLSLAPIDEVQSIQETSHKTVRRLHYESRWWSIKCTARGAPCDKSALMED